MKDAEDNDLTLWHLDHLTNLSTHFLVSGATRWPTRSDKGKATRWTALTRRSPTELIIKILLEFFPHHQDNTPISLLFDGLRALTWKKTIFISYGRVCETVIVSSSPLISVSSPIPCSSPSSSLLELSKKRFMVGRYCFSPRFYHLAVSNLGIWNWWPWCQNSHPTIS